MQPLADTPGYHTRKDETGNRYGRLVVASFDHVDNRGNARWNCHCDCGNDTVQRGSVLRRGETVSCGCFHREQAAELCNTRWDEYRNRLIRAFFTDGLYPQGKPKQETGQ
jgi:hypothetical protein